MSPPLSRVKGPGKGVGISPNGGAVSIPGATDGPAGAHAVEADVERMVYGEDVGLLSRAAHV